MEKPKLYARISRMSIDDHETIHMTGSTDKNCLGNSDLCEYIYTGLFSESGVEEFLISIDIEELYIDSDTLKRFSYGFYQKFRHIIKVNQF